MADPVPATGWSLHSLRAEGGLRFLLTRPSAYWLANRAQVADVPERSGFGPIRLNRKLHSGWNTLDLVVYTDENVNWRWCGISLAFDRKASQGLRFAP